MQQKTIVTLDRHYHPEDKGTYTKVLFQSGTHALTPIPLGKTHCLSTYMR
ncbi:protein of unknown function [Pararobbsia alpina]